MLALLPALICGVLSLAPPTDPPLPDSGPVPYLSIMEDPSRKVRTVDRRIHGLLVQGTRRSATFAGLVAAVNASDVIVYIQRVSKLPPNIAGQMMIVPVAQGPRYLRIQVLDRLAPDETIALIGHELRHALEVAAAPDVKDQAGLAALYMRIGQPGGLAHSFDTRAAQNTGRRVRRELVS